MPTYVISTKDFDSDVDAAISLYRTWLNHVEIYDNHLYVVLHGGTSSKLWIMLKVE